jgi:hypothetical protein
LSVTLLLGQLGFHNTSQVRLWLASFSFSGTEHFVYENGKIRPVETVPRTGEKREGERWGE